MGEVLDISRKVIGIEQLCLLFFSGSLVGGNHVCIVSVFLDIPAVWTGILSLLDSKVTVR
jgi:hypothetical protein